jgi:hypothetical protein
MGVREIGSDNKDTVRQRLKRGHEDALGSVRSQTIFMQHAINECDRSIAAKSATRVSLQPRRLESPMVDAAALSAGAVARCQRGGFVQKE